MAQDLFYHVPITANGAAYDLSPDLCSFTIEEDGTQPDKLTIQVSDPYKVFSHAFQEGMEVEVDLGTADDHSVIFRGRVYKVESEFPEQGVPTIKILAHDKSMSMGLRRRNRPWSDITLSEIVQEIGSEYFDADKIVVQLEGDPRFEGNGVRQQDETDLAFLMRLAAAYGCEMFVVADEEGDWLHFEAQHSIMESEPEVTLYHGRCDVPNHLIRFEASSDISNVQLPRVFSGIEYDSGEPTEVATTPAEELGTAEDEFFDENMAEFSERYPTRAAQLEQMLSAAPAAREALREELGSEEREATSGFTTEEDLRVREQNQFSTSVRGMRGSGTAAGNQRIRAQAPVQISDVGGRFSGTWYLSSVRHIMNGQGYQTEISCQR